MRENGIGEEIVEILKNRGVVTPEEIDKFLNPSEEDMHDPYQFFDMENAIEIIKKHIENKSKILIYGDYDCDGICATIIMQKAIEKAGGKCFCHLPDRFTEGYGLNEKYCDKIIENNYELVVTVDNGIAALNSVEKLKKAGIEVVVTDHHEAGEVLPVADCIIDAKNHKETYPFKDICGAVVAMKVGQALNDYLFYKEVIDLAALATIADAMPLVDENRFIVRKGIEKIYENPAIMTLFRQTGGKELKRTSDLSFGTISAINATGRIGSANEAYKLLINEKAPRGFIEKQAEIISKENDKRKRLQDEAIVDAFENNKIINIEDDVLLSVQNDINLGVIGLVAGRILEKTGKSTISLSKVETPTGIIYKGSGRGNGKINLFKEIEKFRENTLAFGGHADAIGISITEDKLEEFKNFIHSLKDSEKESEEKKYDIEITIKQLNKKLLEQTLKLEPCGNGNPLPIFKIPNVLIRNVANFAGKHFSCDISDDKSKMRLTGFFMDAPKNGNFGDFYVDPNLYIRDYKEIEREISEGEIGTDERSIEILGLTNAKIKQFNNKGIFTINDLLHYTPRKYYNYKNPVTVKEIEEKELWKTEQSIIGTIQHIEQKNTLLWADCIDEQGDSFRAQWFHQPFIAKSLFKGKKMIFCGTVDNFFKIRLIYPKYMYSNIELGTKIFPVYTKITGMSDEYLKNAIELAANINDKEDFLEKKVRKHFDLESEKIALKQVHMPENEEDIASGTARLTFDELYNFSLELSKKNEEEIKKNDVVIERKNVKEDFYKMLPYKPTEDQDGIIEDITSQMEKGDRVNGLIQAEVGYGKTTIAIYAALLLAKNGYQSVILAPTEVLAKQHYDEFKRYADMLGFNTAFVAASIKATEKKKIQKEVSEGKVDIIVGTHSVLNLEYPKLGLLVCDEQHKFGVKQRETLLKLAKKPHYLQMSATPIPRTLCMSIYGKNTKVYEIKTRPGNRKDTLTRISKSDVQTNDFMLSEIKKGHQCYVVCPMIDPNDAEMMKNVKNAKKEYEDILDYYKRKGEKVTAALIYGRMKKEDIAEIIDNFRQGKVDILVSTTIVEVGVNVPNATVMVIKNSERFGLATMHQLRGRVGRGEYQSYCILQPNDINEPKTNVMRYTDNGMEIAEKDAENRGYGDLIGTKQSGQNEIFSLILKNKELYNKINEYIEKEPI